MIPDFLYGTAWKEDRTAELTELALRSGFRGIDTANQRRHYFEVGVGRGLAAAYRAGSAAATLELLARSGAELARAPRDRPRRKLRPPRPRLRSRVDGP